MKAAQLDMFAEPPAKPLTERERWGDVAAPWCYCGHSLSAHCGDSDATATCGRPGCICSGFVEAP